MCGSHLLFSIFGTLGIIGDSNVRCRNISSRADTAGLVGSSCNVGSDCLYGECTSNVCSAPLRQCPSENGKSQRLLYLSSLLFSFFSSFSPPLIYSSLLIHIFHLSLSHYFPSFNSYLRLSLLRQGHMCVPGPFREHTPVLHNP